jgi:hypothetical protein
MTKAQQVALEMLSLEAIDLYIISEELKDAFEEELMRKDPESWFEMGCAILKAKRWTD